MTWTSLDDQWDLSEKLICADDALGSDSPSLMWVKAVTWCNRTLSDGRIHGATLRTLTRHKKPQAVIDVLVEKGAFEKTGADTYAVHDFLDWNESKEVVLAKKAARAAAGSKGGKRSGASRSGKEPDSQPPPTPKPERSKPEANASTLLPDSSSKHEATLKQNEAKPNPSPSPSPSPKESSGSLLLLEPPENPSPEAAASKQEVQHPSLSGILDALKASPKLADVATDGFAREVLSLMFSAGKPLPLVVEAIAAAAFKLPEHSNEPTVRGQIFNFVKHARPARSSASGPRDRPVQPFTEPSGRTAEQRIAEQRQDRERRIAAGEITPDHEDEY